MSDPGQQAVRTLLVLRHGQTDWNLQGRAQGHADIPLNAEGRRQAGLLAQRLTARLSGASQVRLWSSDLVRAADTAALIGRCHGLQARHDARLREFHVGRRQGMTAREYAARFPEEAGGRVGHPGVPVARDAESYEQVRERMSAALAAALDDVAPGGTAVVVTHGAALRVGVVALLGWPDQHVTTLAPVHNCHAVEVRRTGDEAPQLVAYNVPVDPDFASGAGVR